MFGRVLISRPGFLLFGVVLALSVDGVSEESPPLPPLNGGGPLEFEMDMGDSTSELSFDGPSRPASRNCIRRVSR